MQDTFFETTNMPMADLFEAAERPTTTADYLSDEAIDRQHVRAAALMTRTLGKPKPPKKQPCLQCGKQTSAMFCNATCRSKWQAGIERFNARLARTSLAGVEQSLFGG